LHFLLALARRASWFGVHWKLLLIGAAMRAFTLEYTDSASPDGWRFPIASPAFGVCTERNECAHDSTAFRPVDGLFAGLGVKPDATSEDVHAAYRRLARAYHPDTHPGSAEAAVSMARVNVAKAVLLDPHARAAYDSSRNGAHPPAQVHPPRARPKRMRRFDYGTAMMLVVVAPLLLGLLVYFETGVHVAVRPLPFLVC